MEYTLHCCISNVYPMKATTGTCFRRLIAHAARHGSIYGPYPPNYQSKQGIPRSLGWMSVENVALGFKML
jgi:hypothetical protein